jgi:hypothetical protein
MSNRKINANICEINQGAYYPVKLDSIPNVGELIDLWSSIDQADSYPPKKHYQVVQVVHKLQDVSDKHHRTQDGHHFVNIFVKPINSEFFGG